MEIKYWNRIDGSKIALSEMSNKYIRNSINMLTRENSDYEELQSYKDLLEEVERRNKAELEYMGSVELTTGLDKLYKKLEYAKSLERTLQNIIEEKIIEEHIKGYIGACEIMRGYNG